MSMVRKILVPVKKGLAKAALKPALDPALAALALPDSPKEANENFYEFVTMLYGRQGIGKTTFAAGFPDAVLFSCERVSPAIQAFDFNAEAGGVRSWDIFRKGVELLEKSPGRFKTVVIDTVEAAYQLCLSYVCKKRGIEHPGGQNDFGQSWDAIKLEFTLTLDRIWASGRGVVFIGHSAEVEFTAHSGEKFTRIQPALSGMAFKYIKGKTDNIFYAEFVKGANGEPLRILITEGDEVVEAKHAGEIPRYLPFPKKGGADLVARAFRGEALGLDVSKLKTGKETSGQGAKLIEKEAMGKLVSGLKAGRKFSVKA